MLVSVGASPSLDDWFERGENIRAAIHYARNRVLFVSEAESMDFFRAQAKLFLSERDLDAFQSLIQTAPWAKRSIESQEDFNLDSKKPNKTSLNAIEQKDLIDQLLSRRSGKINVGERPQTAFDRIVRPFLPFCRKVVLVDPYAAIDIRNRSGELTFLDELTRGQAFDLEIHSSGVQTRADAEKLAQQVKRVLVDYPQFHGQFEVFIYGADSRKFHNRRLGLLFQNGGLAFQLENSLGNLSRPRFGEEQNFAPISLPSFHSHLRGVQQGLTSLAKI